MSFRTIQPLPSPQEIIDETPLTGKHRIVKLQRDEEIKKALRGESGKFLVIIGPCSAHDETAVIDYVNRLAGVQEVTRDKLVLVPRIYTNKPRTLGTGYKGMMHQPDPSQRPNIAEGIRVIRRLHLRAVSESGLSAADEMLYPDNHPYLDDLLCYVAIGARSVENQQHRLTASGLDIPVGMKNPTCGDTTVMLNSIIAARESHVFTYKGQEVETSGNPLAHAILRGAVDQHGRHIPNYHYEDLMEVAEEYGLRGIDQQAVIVDANHANSGKRHEEQPRIAMEVLHSRRQSATLRKLVRGIMIESFIESGAQAFEEGIYGKSITDPCLGWKETESLLLRIADQV
jgi:3-deoxy-7-phosphoheptulonate synthase